MLANCHSVIEFFIGETTMTAKPDDSLGSAGVLYNETLDADKTKYILDLLRRLTGGPEVEAKRLAYEAIILLCDYLNQWNEPDKANRENIGNELKKVQDVYPDLAPAFYAQGFLDRTNGEHEAAFLSFSRATEIDPCYHRAYAQKGNELLYLGFPERALTEVWKAIELSPGSAAQGMYQWILGRTYFFMENYHEAIRWLRLSKQSWTKLFYNRLYLVSAYALIGDEESARQELREFESIFEDYTIGRVIKNEETNPNRLPFVVEGRRKYHFGLRIAGMKP
jgi:tetratricopeptide (TPR) repeat protein